MYIIRIPPPPPLPTFIHVAGSLYQPKLRRFSREQFPAPEPRGGLHGISVSPGTTQEDLGDICGGQEPRVCREHTQDALLL